MNKSFKKSQTKRILILVENLYEDLELWYPKIRLQEEGFKVLVAGPENKTYCGKHGLSVIPDVDINSINESDFDGLVIPGGFAPDWLRRLPQVLALVKEFNRSNKLIAFICHAGWVPISAKILKGRHVTSLPAIKDDMINAGAIWQDLPVVIDRNLVSSRRPDDLPQFCKGIISLLNN